MSKLFQRIGTKTYKFAIELHLEEVRIDIPTSCNIAVCLKRGTTKIHAEFYYVPVKALIK